MRRWMLAFWVTMTLVLWASTASAVPFPTPQTVYTLDGSVSITPGGALPTLTGTLDPVGDEVGDLDDAVCLTSVAPVTCDIGNILTQDWLVFTVSITAGSLDELGFSAPFLDAEMIGYFAGTGDAPTAGSLAVADSPNFSFNALSGTSAILFVAFADGTLPNSNFLDPPGIPVGPMGQVNFMVSETGNPGNQTFQGIATTTINVIPEPATAMLLAAGLVGLTLVGRRAS